MLQRAVWRCAQTLVVHSLNCVQLFVTSWTTAHRASPSFTISQSWLKLMSIESVMPSNHLIPCHPLLLLPSIFPSLRVFSNELVLCIKWPKYRRFSFSGRGAYPPKSRRWLDSNTDSVDMDLSKLLEMVEDRGAWHAVVHGVAKSQTQLSDSATILQEGWLDYIGCPYSKDHISFRNSFSLPKGRLR